MSNPEQEFTQDPFIRATLLNMEAIAESALPYTLGKSQPGALSRIASAKYAAENNTVRPTVMPFDSTEWELDLLVKRVNESQVLPPRGVMVQELETVRDVIAAEADAILALTDMLGNKRVGETEDYSGIDIFKAMFVAEGGANKTSVVRRAVAEKAMRAVRGNASLINDILYQFGSDRLIAPLVQDKKNGGMIPNAEFDTIRSLAPNLPEGIAFTEFDANYATAVADGYFLVANWESQPNRDESIQTITLQHPNPSRPTLCLVKPVGKGFSGALETLARIENITSRQIVVASNGQYRAKNQVVLQRFTDRHPELQLYPGVAIGDEPGDVAPFAGGHIMTPPRPLGAYVNELPIYYRAAKAWLLEREIDSITTPEDNVVLLEAARRDGATVRLTPKAIELILFAAA
jgi:hypothetical protein